MTKLVNINSGVRTFTDAVAAMNAIAEIYERNQRAFAVEQQEWVNLRRGLERETRDADGSLRGDASDETSQRGFWQRYRELMTAAGA